jgi:hypothetical protein
VGVNTRSERENQQVFRRANERLLNAVSERVDGKRALPFLCECLDPYCRSTVELTTERFRSVMKEPSQFAIVAGHPLMDGERVIASEGNVNIVVKDG